MRPAADDGFENFDLFGSTEGAEIQKLIFCIDGSEFQSFKAIECYQ